VSCFSGCLLLLLHHTPTLLRDAVPASVIGWGGMVMIGVVGMLRYT
jgi:hypothetical protein